MSPGSWSRWWVRAALGIKLVGIGMSTAILVDATIVRVALGPALLRQPGRANWWMPAWLDRAVPHLAPETR